MKCKCGKECGIRIWCKECEEKAIRHLKIIAAEIKYKRKKFEREISKIFDELDRKTRD